jgi:hypothetical protein
MGARRSTHAAVMWLELQGNKDLSPAKKKTSIEFYRGNLIEQNAFSYIRMEK